MKNRVILSVNDLVVKFRVRNRILTAIRNISFDIYDGETIAIVGESGSGKSVLTKTFTNMLESNGYISNGSINYYPSLETKEDPTAEIRKDVDLVAYHRNALERKTIQGIKKNNKKAISNLTNEINNLQNFSLDKAQAQIKDLKVKLKNLESQEKSKFYGLSSAVKKKENLIAEIKKIERRILEVKEGTDSLVLRINNQINDLKQENAQFKLINKGKKKKINEGIILLTSYLSGEAKVVALQNYYDSFLVQLDYRNSTENNLFNTYFSIINDKKYSLTQDEIDFISEGWKVEKRTHFIAKLKSEKDLRRLRGGTIATIFQDPMTSLNPLLSVGYQIIQALKENNSISHSAAKREAVELLKKVGIPNPEKRMKELPGKYSGGMRQRVVIAIALACKPKILICDEPTTALDVTIQAQILDLIKQLKKEYGFTVIFITHDLGVVANVADRVAIVYAGQIIEYGEINEIFFKPEHPYTWALLSSLPQLGKKGEDLFSLAGTPPSLFQKIQGDAFAPRNKYALEIDYLYEPPMFRVSDTHFAKTWLLDSRSPKVNRPKELESLKQAISDMKVGD